MVHIKTCTVSFLKSNCFFPIFFHPQLIIITGPSYEALASEGIQLNMGSANVEEVTCTVIGGVTYNQVCASDSKLRTEEDEDSMAGVLHSKLTLHPLVITQNAYTLGLHCTGRRADSTGLSMQLCKGDSREFGCRQTRD